MTSTRTTDSQSGGDARSGSNLERVTVNLTPRSVHAMSRIIDLTGGTKTDAINSALQFYAYIKEFINGGGGVYMRDADSNALERIRIF